MQIKYSCLILIFVLNFLVLSCSNNKEEILAKKEKKAQEMLEKANKLLSVGKELEALKIFDSLAKEFPETDVKKTAEKQLMKKGISIGNSLTSWTSQRMFKMENTIIAYRDEKGVYPSGHEVKQPKDAWGNQIYYKLYHDKKGYDFIVFSHGPDRKKGTEDDILVVHTKDKNDAAQRNTPPSGQGAISLDQLEGLANSQSSGEATVSLEQLSEMAKSKSSGSSETELSLDELRNLSGNN